MAGDNSCTFAVPRLRMRLSDVRFRPTVCGSNLLTSVRQASKPAPRVVFCTMSNASPSRSSTSATWTCGCPRNRDLLRRRPLVDMGMSCCAAQSRVSPRRCDPCCGHVLKLERQILHDAALESKSSPTSKNVQDSMDNLRCLGAAGSGVLPSPSAASTFQRSHKSAS